MKKEIGEKKKHRKEYLYAVAVLGVVGLLFAMATGVPIGAQVAVPALSSVAYFFDGGHGGNELFTWYYFVKHQSVKDALIHALYSTGIGWLLDLLGVNVITSVADVLASLVQAAGEVTASMIIEAFALAGVSASVIEILIPVGAVLVFW